MKLTLAVYFLATCFASAGPLWFTYMEDGDRVEVTEHSTGCFHNDVSYFEIEKRQGVYSFREYVVTWEKGIAPKILEKKAVGEITLELSDVERLDGLLGFYRGDKEASSTTVVSLVFEYFEPKGRVGIERLIDGSGGYGLEKRKDVITFQELAHRFGN